MKRIVARAHCAAKMTAIAVVVATAGAVMTAGSVEAAARKACMTDHFHYGSSSGQATRKVAEREAIASWQGFTAWEYGDAWGSYRKARSKGMSCTQSSSGWGCNVEGVPCR